MGVFSPEQSSSVEDQLPTGSSLFGATFKTIAGAGRGGRCRRRDRGVSTPDRTQRHDVFHSSADADAQPADTPETPVRAVAPLRPRHPSRGRWPLRGRAGAQPSAPDVGRGGHAGPRGSALLLRPTAGNREAASLWPAPDRGEELLLRNEAWPGVQGCLRGAAPRLRSREGACLRAPAPQAPAPFPTERTPTSGSWASVLSSGPRPAGPRWAGNTAGGHVLTPGPLHILSLRPRFRFPRHPAASSFLLPARPQACHLLGEGPPLPSSPRCSPASVHRLHF